MGEYYGIDSDDDTTIVCPECDRASLTVNSATDGESARYRCAHCYAMTDDPPTREKKHNGHRRRGLAGDLEAATPEEVVDSE